MDFEIEPTSSFTPGSYQVKIPEQLEGAGYTLCPSGTKRPSERGWERRPHTYDEANAHLAAGGNVGLAAGYAGLYVLDMDSGAARGHACAQLAGTLCFFRENAPDRAKFVFRCRDRLQARKWMAHGVELLAWASTGGFGNAIIAGVHESGAPILAGGHCIVELDSAALYALIAEWTDGAADPNANSDAGSGVPLDGASADALLADAVAKSADHGRNNTGFSLACALRDLGASSEVAARVLKRYQQDVTRADRPYTWREADTSLRSAYSRPPHPSNAAEIGRDLAAHRAWLMEPAGVAFLRENVSVRVESAAKPLMALIDLCDRAGSLTVTPGFRRWGEMYNASAGAVQNMAIKLQRAGLIRIEAPLEADATAAYRITLVLRSLNTDTLPLLCVQRAQNYNEYRLNDAFVDNHAAYIKRRPAGLPPLGATALRVLAYLLGNEYTLQVLAADSGLSYAAVQRAVKKFYRYGLVEIAGVGRRNLKTYRLCDAWREDLATLVRAMTTHGLLLRRRVRNLEARIQFAKVYGAPPDKLARWQAEYDRLAAVEHAAWADQNARTPSVHPQTVDKPSDWVRARKRPDRKWLRHDHSARIEELENGPLLLLMRQIQSMKLEGVKGREIERLLLLAGYESEEVNQAWWRVDRGDWPEVEIERLRANHREQVAGKTPMTAEARRELASMRMRYAPPMPLLEMEAATADVVDA